MFLLHLSFLLLPLLLLLPLPLLGFHAIWVWWRNPRILHYFLLFILGLDKIFPLVDLSLFWFRETFLGSFLIIPTMA